MRRFAGCKQAVSYCGLCGAEDSSAGKQKRTPISKQRNKHLQTVLIEAAKLALRYNPELALLYEQEKKKGNCNRATLAVAGNWSPTCSRSIGGKPGSYDNQPPRRLLRSRHRQLAAEKRSNCRRAQPARPCPSGAGRRKATSRGLHAACFEAGRGTQTQSSVRVQAPQTANGCPVRLFLPGPLPTGPISCSATACYRSPGSF